MGITGTPPKNYSKIPQADTDSYIDGHNNFIRRLEHWDIYQLEGGNEHENIED